MGKGLVWNGISSTDIPVVFMPLTIGPSTAVPLGTWPAATSSSTSDSAYETIGPQVFRFEYCYLLKADGSLSITPPTNVSGIAAIVADIAVIDSKSKVLLNNTKIATFNTPGQVNFLSEYASGMIPGQLRAQWQNTINNARDPNTNAPLPPPALSGIRLYERFLYLSPPVL